MPGNQQRISDEIRRLRDEAQQQSFERPGWMSLAVNHPGILAYQVKTQPHYERDMRQAAWLESVAKMRDADWARGNSGEWTDLNPDFLAAVDRRDELKTPYWNRGVLAVGQPIRNGTDWFQAVASSGLNAGRMIAGVEGADEDFEQSASRILGGLPLEAMGRKSNQQLAWEAEREDAANRPMGDLSFVQEPVQSSGRWLPRPTVYEQVNLMGMSDGDTVTKEMGMQEGPLQRAASMAIDVATDPVNELGVGIRALLKGQLGRAAGSFASEAALPATFYGVSESMRREMERQQQRNVYAQRQQSPAVNR